MSNNRPSAEGLAQQNYQKKDENKDIRGGVTGEGQELSEEDELQIRDDLQGVSDGQMEVNQVQYRAHTQSLTPRLQQQPTESVVRWDRFLPVRSLKVLLVEGDDSTRHVVSALLRNCGYQVTDLGNGGQAWKFLEDLTNHIDLILTEVSVPCLSGIALLSKIMNHKTRKNIPVIMMSSHGTMSVVFKCLSKGAVDFLVKPIRKNELKNLWQHVWRKCHSQSSGSGSESGIQTQNFNKLKSGESNNNSGSNDGDDIESVAPDRDGSDNGTGTQSSWTKRAIETHSPQRVSTSDQSADPPDSTCAQVIHLRPEAFSSNWVPVNATRDLEAQDAETDNDVMGKDLKIGVPRNANPPTKEPSKKTVTAGNTTYEGSKNDCKRNEGQLEMNQSEPESEKTQDESQNKAVDLLGSIAINTDPQMEIVDFNSPGALSKAPNGKDKAMHSVNGMPSLELSLKRMRDDQDIETNAHDRNTLRHSGVSAFSKYTSSLPTSLAPTGIVGSYSPADNSSEAAKRESGQNLESNSNSPPPNQGSNGGSNGSSNNNDMGSTTNDAIKGHHPSSVFQPVDSTRTFPPRPTLESSNQADAVAGKMNQGQSQDANQQVLLHHHNHHHHHHHHHHHMISGHDDMSNATALQCGSSNVLEGNVANSSLNGSGSGSNHGSNYGQNGSTAPLNAQKIDHDRNSKMTAKCGAAVGIGHVDSNMVDQNRNAQREAALNKFRQKRKERCFEKKVRYHSRKKLAEQRPRIRGQFVRHNADSNNNNNSSSKGMDPS